MFWNFSEYISNIKLKTSKSNSAHYERYLSILFEICQIGIYDSKTSCITILANCQLLFKSSPFNLETSVSIFNNVMNPIVYQIFNHHQKKYKPLIDTILKEAPNSDSLPNLHKMVEEIDKMPKLFPPKLKSVMSDRLNEFYAEKLVPCIEKSVKAFSMSELKCQKMTTLHGDVSKEVSAEYDENFRIVNAIRDMCLKFSNITHMVIQKFSEDEKIDDIRDVTVTQQDLDKMFATVEELQFYKQLMDVKEKIGELRGSKIQQQMQSLSLDAKSSFEIDDVVEKVPSPLSNASINDFLRKLTNCYNRDLVDSYIVEYFESYHTKNACKKLLTALLSIKSLQPEFLPFAGRIIATMNCIIPDMAKTVSQFLLSDFNKSVGQNRLPNLELKLKTVRYISNFLHIVITFFLNELMPL